MLLLYLVLGIACPEITHSDALYNHRSALYVKGRCELDATPITSVSSCKAACAQIGVEWKGVVHTNLCPNHCYLKDWTSCHFNAQGNEWPTSNQCLALCHNHCWRSTTQANCIASSGCSWICEPSRLHLPSKVDISSRTKHLLCRCQSSKQAPEVDNMTHKLRFAMSCSTKGRYKEKCAEIKTGLDFFKDAVNTGKQFRTVRGFPVSIDVDIRDDQSNNVTAQKIYQELVHEPYDALLAPFAPELSDVAARETNFTGRLLMMHSPTYGRAYPAHVSNAFTTSLPESQHMIDSLRKLKTLGAKTVYYVAQDMPEYHSCRFSREQLSVMGLELIGGFTLEISSIVRDVRGIRRQIADVLVACGTYENMIMLVVTMRSLRVHPRALLMLHASSDHFVNAVGASNVNYIFSPKSWHPDSVSAPASMDENYFPQSVYQPFVSSNDFAEKFQAVHGRQPSSTVAHVVAAALALVVAFTNSPHLQKPPNNGNDTGHLIDQTLYGQSLLALGATHSFFGKLEFQANGLLNRSGMTVQLQPLEKSFSAVDRYLKSKLALVSLPFGDSQALYPMPFWVEKELEVYPCDVGHELNGVTPPNLGCQACPQGRYRDANMLFCRICFEGTYAPGDGNSNCQPCPMGANCATPLEFEEGLPPSSPGYYYLPGPPLTWQSCSPPEACAGKNECRTMNEGALCAGCQEGYVNWQGDESFDGSHCRTCSVYVGVVMRCIGIAIIYVAAVYLLSRLTSKSAKSMKYIHSVIVKLVINYAVFATVALEVAEVRFPASLSYIIGLTQNPVLRLVDMDCLGEKLFSNRDKVVLLRLYFGLALLPFTLLANVLVWVVFKYYKMSDFANKAQRMAEANQRLPNDQDDNVEQPEDVDQEVRRKFMDTSNKVDKLIRSSLIWIFVLYPVVVRMLLESISCIHFDTFRVKTRLGVTCFVGEHVSTMNLAIGGLIVYGVGVPAAIYVLVRRASGQLSHRRTRETLGFLFNGFDPSHYDFEPVMMLRKLAVLLCTAIPVRYTRLVVMMFVSFACLALHMHTRPYDSRDMSALNRIELASLRAFVTIVALEFVVAVRDSSRESNPVIYRTIQHPLFDAAVVLAKAYFHIHFWSLVAWTSLRNVVLKDLDFQAQVAPTSLSRFEKFLLWFENCQNRIVFDCNSHRFNLTGLNKAERRSFHDTLCNVVKLYVYSGHPFHPGRIVTALREALCLVIRERQVRAVNLLHELAMRERVKPRIQRWKDTLEGWMERIFSPETAKKARRARAAALQSLPKDISFKADNIKALSGKAISKRFSNKTFGDPVAKRAALRAQIKAETWNSATVEEIQAALMLCQAKISEHHPLFFEVEAPPIDSVRKPEDGFDNHGTAVLRSPSKLSADDATNADEVSRFDTAAVLNHEVIYKVSKDWLNMEVGTLKHRCEILEAEKKSLLDEAKELRKELAEFEEMNPGNLGETMLPHEQLTLDQYSIPILPPRETAPAPPVSDPSALTHQYGIDETRGKSTETKFVSQSLTSLPTSATRTVDSSESPEKQLVTTSQASKRGNGRNSEDKSPIILSIVDLGTIAANDPATELKPSTLGRKADDLSPRSIAREKVEEWKRQALGKKEALEQPVQQVDSDLQKRAATAAKAIGGHYLRSTLSSTVVGGYMPSNVEYPDPLNSKGLGPQRSAGEG